VPLDHEGYLLYAGMDPILTGILRNTLSRKVPSSARNLIPYEHELAMYCAQMERRGFLLDIDYTIQKEGELEQERADWEAKALELGLENVNSPKQVAEAFMRYGWKPEKDQYTATGQPQVNKKTLDALVKQGYELAVCVQKAKQATKWNAAYYRTFLDEVDEDGRIHPGIHTMQARTARMSITRPALQTLPSGDKQVRHAFLAEPGEVIVSIDYANQELRVAAALSGDQRMRRAFVDGEDLHKVTADGAGVDRKTGKMANFLVCFGGGWKALVTQGGVSEEIAKKTIDGFNRTYPAVPKLAEKLGKEAKIRGYIETHTGRRLYVDKQRTYSAINYAIQSGARDITASGIIKCFRNGLGEYIRLPIHDEVVSSVPKNEAKEIAQAISENLNSSLLGVEIPTDIEIGERTWGSAK
jgi:DNA polymerase I